MTNVTTQNKTIAVLGTGIMGSAIARNLKKNGFEVHVWNRNYEKAKPLTDTGIIVNKDIADAVKDAEIILTMLKDGPAVVETINQAIPNIKQGKIWIQASTVGIDANTQLENIAKNHSLSYYDAPVQGTKGPAEQGKLIIIASGPLNNKDVVQTVFDAIGQRTVWVSENSGDSSKLKLALNSWAFALTHGIAESISLAEGLGVDPKLIIDVVTGGPMDNLYFQLKSSAILSNNFEASFTLENAIKDSELVIQASKEKGINVDGVEAGLARFKRAQQLGHSKEDMAASYFAK